MRKTDEERLHDLEKKITQIKAKKELLERRLKEKERKERTRKLIQIGAIFERNFEISDLEEAERIALSYKQLVKEQKENIQKVDIDKSKERGTIVYKEQEEQIFIPESSNDTYIP